MKREILEETGIEISNVKLVANFVMTVHYFEKNLPKTLEHHCCIYKILNFDESNFQSDIFDQDVNGSMWVEKKELNHIMLSPLAEKITNQIFKNSF